MAFSGLGISDLLNLAQIAYDIYQYCEGAPDDLKGLLQKFQYIGDQLKLLNTVIVSSGWSEYDKTAELRELFKDAKAFFVKHDALLHNSATGTSKLGKLARLKMDADDMRNIENRVDEQMKRMQDFKTNVMFLASVRTLQDSRTTLQRQKSRPSDRADGVSNAQPSRIILAGRPQQLIVEARTDSDVISVISEATTALQFATKLKRRTPAPFQANLESIIASSPEVVALPSSSDRDMIENFIVESERLVEKLHLYNDQASPTRHVDDLSKFIEKANQLTRDLRPSKAGISAEVRSLRLPTIEPSPHSFSDSFLKSPEFQRWAASSPELDRGMMTAHDQMSMVLGQPARSITRSTSTQTGSDAMFSMRSLSFSEAAAEVGGPAKEHIDLTGWIKIYAGKQTSSQRVSCTLDITWSEGSVCIWAVATSRRRTSSTLQSPLLPAAMTPGILMHGHQADVVSDREGPFRTFKHSFDNNSKPMPYALHPSAEGPVARENYAITFHSPQYFLEERYPHRWSTELKYIFQNESDRNTVRSKIFGKKLLRSAGAEKITFNYIACHQQDITMWEDANTKIKTITFYRDLQNSKSHPPSDMEYKILGITDLKRAEKEGEPLPLNVEQINQIPMPGSTASRRSSEMTVFSNKSTRTRNDMSCSIYFSEPKDKKAFVRIIKQRPPS